MPRYECEDCGQRWRASSSRRCPECGSRDVVELVESRKTSLSTFLGCVFGPVILLLVCSGIINSLGKPSAAPNQLAQPVNKPAAPPPPPVTKVEPKAPPVNDPPARRIALRGDRAFINDDVYGGLTDKAASEFMDYLIAKNRDAANRMIRRGEVIFVAKDTAVDVVSPGIFTYRVRIAAGAGEGVEVVVPSEYVRK